jgi:hypothetical protein
LDIFNVALSLFMRALHVVSAGLMAAIPPLEHVSTAMKPRLGVMGCCGLKTSAQWDLSSGQVL